MFNNFLILMTTLMATLVHANDQAPSVGDTCGWFSESQFTSYTATCKWSHDCVNMEVSWASVWGYPVTFYEGNNCGGNVALAVNTPTTKTSYWPKNVKSYKCNWPQ